MKVAAALVLCSALLLLLSMATAAPQRPSEELEPPMASRLVDEITDLTKKAIHRVEDTVDQDIDSLSDVLGKIENTIHPTPAPTFWERFSSGFSRTYEKVKKESKELADRISESIG